MEKFRSFKSITDEYLKGKLVDLHLDYKDEDTVNILVSYECNNFFTLDYEVNVDLKKHDVEFVSHGSQKAFQRIRLDKEPEFDMAIKKIFS
jgi:hypothetical protein